MKLEEFAEAAHRVFAEIPEEYRQGVDGLDVRSEALPHPTRGDVYTLGMCLTESYPSDWMGPETTRSLVVLYHGSFQRLARLDPTFDWDRELWETLTHELRHHLESLANQDQLEAMDYAVEEGFRRFDGEDFDPFYYQSGDRIEDGIYQVEEDFYVEQTWSPGEFAQADSLRFSWHGTQYRIPRPEELGDVHFILVDGVDVGPGSLELVLVRGRSGLTRVRETLRGKAVEVLESQAVADSEP